MYLAQSEFAYLMKLEKEFDTTNELMLASGSWLRGIKSITSNDTFLLDFRRGKIEFKKYTLNKRFKTSIVLLRYDSMGKHTNPPGTDESKFDGSHVHIYREGFLDKWAFPVQEIGVELGDDTGDIVVKIFKYCNIINYPPVNIPLI